MQLKNWSIKTAKKGEDYFFYLKGNVYGHTKPTCSDGTYIHTSTIVSAEDEGETLAVKTSHSLYTISKSEMDTTISVDVVRDFCEKFLGGNTELAETAKKKYSEFLWNRRFIHSGMLYLQLSADRENYFAGALYREQDSTLKEDYAVVHVSTFEDSVILKNSGVRWFNRSSGVEFYKTLYSAVAHKKPVLGYIRNVGLTPITVTFSFGGTATIMPDELYEVKAAKQENSCE